MSESKMKNSYLIEPWDHLMMTQSPDGSVHDQYVPPELEELARQVMRRYDMSVSSMVLITAKPDKGGAIWRIDTDKGPRSIKVLHRTPNRSLFSIGAQDYLVKQGARVPALIPTTDGELYVNAGGKSWIVTDWIEELTPVSKVDMSGVQDLCRGLGEFHHHSRGYVPPFGAVKASRLHRWPQHYEKIIAKLNWFEEIAKVYSEYPASETLLAMLPIVKKEAQDYYAMFRDSAYQRMISMGEPHWGLAHQDYGWSNGQKGPGGVWIIDLDGVAYDIPIRDLRKLITSTMVDNGGWDIDWVRGMIGAYNEGNPLDRETFELLWIDMAFPNEFYKHVKEVVYEPETFMPTELEPILNMIRAVELSKWDVLQELRDDMDQYPSGDYPAVADASPIAVPIMLPEAAAAAELPVFKQPQAEAEAPAAAGEAAFAAELERAAAVAKAEAEALAASLLAEEAAPPRDAAPQPAPAKPLVIPAAEAAAVGRVPVSRVRRKRRARSGAGRPAGRVSGGSLASRPKRGNRRTRSGLSRPGVAASSAVGSQAGSAQADGMSAAERVSRVLQKPATSRTGAGAAAGSGQRSARRSRTRASARRSSARRTGRRGGTALARRRRLTGKSSRAGTRRTVGRTRVASPGRKTRSRGRGA